MPSCYDALLSLTLCNKGKLVSAVNTYYNQNEANMSWCSFWYGFKDKETGLRAKHNAYTTSEPTPIYLKKGTPFKNRCTDEKYKKSIHYGRSHSDI